MSGWFWGNILLGGLIGMAIDLISGNWRVHDSTLDVQLIEHGSPTHPAEAPPQP